MTHSGTLVSVGGTRSTQNSNVKMNSFFMRIQRVQQHTMVKKGDRVWVKMYSSYILVTVLGVRPESVSRTHSERVITFHRHGDRLDIVTVPLTAIVNSPL